MQDGVTIDHSDEHVLPVDGYEKVTIINGNGKISVGTWDKDQAFVRATKVVRAKSSELAEGLLRKVEYSISQQGEELVIETNNIKSLKLGEEARVTYEVFIPASVALSMIAFEGEITAEGMSGATSANLMGDGLLRLLEIGGKVEISTMSGNVEVSVADHADSLNLSAVTLGGNVLVKVPRNFDGEVRAATQGGALTTDFPLRERAGEKDGEGVDRVINVSANSGDITIRAI